MQPPRGGSILAGSYRYREAKPASGIGFAPLMRDCPLCRACENKICTWCASHECLNNDTDMPMPAPADVELVDVTKRFGSVVAVEHLTLTIPAGTYACLLGPIGCGKTTTLRLLAGHERVTSGESRIR